MPYSRTPAGRAHYQYLVALHRGRFPEFFNILEGIAEGAGVPFEKLFVIHLRGEYQRYAADGGEGGCSTCNLQSPATPQDKPAFTAFCYPGFLPGNAFGFNDAGICISANNVQPCRSIRGFSSSLSQSAKRLIPTTSSTRAAPGNTIIHHMPA